MQKKTGVAIFDWLLVVVIVALLMVVAFFVLSSPRCWLWCLDILDVRGWSHWTWTGVVVALFMVLAVIRYWPDRKPATLLSDVVASTSCTFPEGRGNASRAALEESSLRSE